MQEPPSLFATVPMQWVGPLRLVYHGADEEVSVPLATYESPLWPSTARGAIRQLSISSFAAISSLR